MGEFIDCLGKRFGMLVAVQRLPNEKGAIRWRCVCDCGREVVKRSQDLRARVGRAQHCGCQPRADSGAASVNWTGVGRVPGAYWRRVVSNALSRGHSVEVTLAEVAELFEVQEGRCALSGLPIQFVAAKQYTASLDRIDSSKGYVRGNIQWVHRDVNMMKNTLPEDRFLALCAAIAGHKGRTILLRSLNG